jgi:signal transduction histidine kinase
VVASSPPVSLPRKPGSSPAWTVFVWFAAIAYPILLVAMWTIWRYEPAGWQVLYPAITTAMPAGLLRRKPAVALALMLAGSILVSVVYPVPILAGIFDDRSQLARYLQFVSVDIGVAVIAATRSRRFSLLAAVVTALVHAACATFQTPLMGDTLVTMAVLTTVAAWAIGNSVRQRRVYAETMRAQAAARAVTDERLRIARELHDMVAHSIGIIAIQAGMGARVIDTQPAEARNALATIEATSRETLAGLRHTVDTLRQGKVAREAAPLAPAPGLADLDRLTAATADAGVRVELRREGRPRPVPAHLDLSAFRIIQEALTNVVRHAGTDHCTVAVSYEDDQLGIEIVDDGIGAGSSGTGYGITGMRERVSLLHGEFTAGPRPEGGFRVAASLPLPAAERS